MGQLVPKFILQFDGGQSNDPREPAPTASTLVRHFDIYSYPYKLFPYRSTKTDTATNISSTDAKQYDIRNFQLCSNGKIFGLGKNASGYPKVLLKTDPTQGNWLASDGSNAATAIGEGNAARISGCFIEWQGAFWFFQGTNQIAKVDTTSGVITNSVANVGSTITSVAQGVIANNTLYLFYNNKVVTVSAGGVVQDNVFTTLPSDMRITSCCRYGAYMMIGMAFGTATTTIPNNRSIVVQWDMNSSTVPSDVLDWGEGALKVLGNVEGRVVGVSDKYLSSILGLARGSMVVRMWAGGAPQVMKEIVANQTVPADTATITRFPNDVVIKNNKMYWVASVPFGLSTTTESTYNLGIWCFGRKNVNANFTVSLDFIEQGVDVNNYHINSFGAAGDYWFINHSADGSVTSTDNNANFTFTSSFETQIIADILIKITSRYRIIPDASVTKKLLSATLFFEPLPVGATIVLKYRKDGDTAYTQIFSYSTVGGQRHTAVNIESTGTQFPQYKEIVFRFESTGNAVITGFKSHSEMIDDDITS